MNFILYEERDFYSKITCGHITHVSVCVCLDAFQYVSHKHNKKDTNYYLQCAYIYVKSQYISLSNHENYSWLCG